MTRRLRREDLHGGMLVRGHGHAPVQHEIHDHCGDLAVQAVHARRALDPSVGPEQQQMEFLDDQHGSTLRAAADPGIPRAADPGDAA